MMTVFNGSYLTMWRRVWSIHSS